MAPRKVLFISKSDQAASTRYRALDFFSRLRGAGWTPLHRSMPKSFSGWRHLLQEVREASVTVLMRRLPGVWARRRLRQAARHLVFDFDDAVNHGTGPQPSAQRQRRFAAMLKLCDQVWAGNPHLVQTARALNPHVHGLPTCLDPEAYAVAPKKPADHLDLVWIGSSATRIYLERQCPTLEKFAETCPSMRLKIVADFDLPSCGFTTVPVGWARATEADALASAHVGLAPMPDNAWTRGKCGCKVLQYMAASVPVVASDVPIHRDILSGGGGHLVGDGEQWLEALNALHQDIDHRKTLGDAGRRAFLARFTLDQAAERMVQLLASAVD